MARTLYEVPANELKPSIDTYYGQAALGPDYGIGHLVPATVGSAYHPPTPVVIPENWGKIGPIPGREGGINRLRQIHLDTGLGPVDNPNYNLAEPQGLYHLKIVTADQLAIQMTNQGNSDIVPIPVTFEPGGPASLYGGK